MSVHLLPYLKKKKKKTGKKKKKPKFGASSKIYLITSITYKNMYNNTLLLFMTMTEI